jgi:hypothetical protein
VMYEFTIPEDYPSEIQIWRTNLRFWNYEL